MELPNLVYPAESVTRGPVLNIRTIIREPLVHFLCAGAVLLAASAAMNRLAPTPDRIDITAARIQQFRDTWIARWGAPPTRAELQGLIDDFVREEVFYREAVGSGLDRDDTIVRRHLARKVEFMAESLAAAVPPAPDDVRRFFEQHREKYRTTVQVAFSHVYFSAARRGGAGVERAALNVLGGLAAGKFSTDELTTLGDSSMLQHDYPAQTKEQVRNLFGPQFANRVFELSPDRWEGPIESSYGLHLVKVKSVLPARAPELEEVYEQVLNDFAADRLRSASDAYYRRLRERVRIHVDEKAFEAGISAREEQ